MGKRLCRIVWPSDIMRHCDVQILQRLFTYVKGSSSLLITLRDFVRCGPDGCRVARRTGGLEGGTSASGAGRLQPLELNATLAESMRGQAVLEYPRLVVDLVSECHDALYASAPLQECLPTGARVCKAA